MKYAHIDKETGELLCWYADDVHGVWIEPIYKEKVIKEEEKDDNGNIIQEKVLEKVLVKDGYHDISKIPTPNIKVDYDTWQKALSINANYYNSKTKKFEVKDFRTKNQIEEESLRTKKNEADRYLKDTDWIKDYKLRHDLGLEPILEDSNKWEIIKQREIYLEFLKTL